MTKSGRDKMGSDSDVNDRANRIAGTPKAHRASQSIMRTMWSQLSALWKLLDLNLPTVLMMLKLVFKSVFA
jgi:hypothetical protein